MNKQKYKSFLADSIFEKQVWMLLASVVLVSNVFLSLKIYSMTTAEKTIIHPVNLTKSYVVDGLEYDPLAIGKLAETFLKGRFLYTPKTVATQFNNLASHFHPSIYGEKKAELDAQVARIIRNDETSVLFPLSSHVKQNVAYIEAEITGYLGKKEVSKGIKRFQVEFRNSGGRLWLFNWEEVFLDPSGKNYIQVSNSDVDINQGI